MKNSNGITLIMLVITIIALVIIAGVSVSTGLSFIEDVRIGRIIANMELIQSKAEIIYEEYQFNHENITVGIKQDDVDEIKNTENISDADKDILDSAGDWYKWDIDVLEEQNLSVDMLDAEEAYFLVNYETSEIIYSIGTAVGGKIYFSKTALEEILSE